MKSKRLVLAVAAVAMMVAGGTSVGLAQSDGQSGGSTVGSPDSGGVAIQTHDLNKACSNSYFQTSSTTFVALPDMEVTVKTGYGAKDVVLDFSSELAAIGNSGQLGYSIDGGPFVPTGPSWFNNNDTNKWNTQSFMTVLQLKGTHTIRPGLRAEAPATVHSQNRCLTARLGPA